MKPGGIARAHRARLQQLDSQRASAMLSVGITTSSVALGLAGYAASRGDLGSAMSLAALSVGALPLAPALGRPRRG